MKKVSLVLVLFITLLTSNVKAQGFGQSDFTLGPTLGVSWGAAFGLTGEYGLTDNWGLGGDFVYTSYKSFYTYNLIGIVAAGSYHFMPGNEWDPYLKGGLGFFNWSNDAPNGWNVAQESGVGFILQAGCRYFFNDQIAARVSLGFPYYIGLGVDFKLK